MKSPKERAEELLRKMTIPEKVGQLNQHLYGFRIYDRKEGKIEFSEDLKAEVEKFGGIGTIYGLYRADPWSERDYETGLPGALSVKTYNLLQNYVMEHSRLGIPFLLSSECPHGHQALDGYLLPVNLAVGATFHPELLEQAGKVCGKQLHSMGVDFALVSALDILRDPRWGRSEECYGEDPYLASEFAKAIVNGIQKEHVGVVAKHFCAQGETTGGVNASAARIGQRELREIHLPAAKACCEAGVKGIMAAYNEIDGVFCHGNKQLLTDILRTEFGFSGMVMADGIAIDQLDLVTGDNIRSAALALKSGVDISLWDEGFTKLEEALAQGLIQETDLDRAVLRVLTYKFEQGLFDRPYIDEQGERTSHYTKGGGTDRYTNDGSASIYTEDEKTGHHMKDEKSDDHNMSEKISCYNKDGSCQFTYEENPESELLARESAVLLKNDGLLPLRDKNISIALIGPNADDIYRQLGDYSPAVKKEECYTLKSGLEMEFGSDNIHYHDGHSIPEAVQTASQCDVVILALGGSSSRFQGAVFDENGAARAEGEMHMDCGEGMDTARLELPGNQTQLFQAIKEVNKKVVSVIIAGRPYAIEDIAADTDALLYAFYPGPMGGKAIAELLSGTHSPSGRLPVSLPRCAGQVPVYYNHTTSYPALHYCDTRQGALFAFGEGMGYSEMEYDTFLIKKEAGSFHLSGVVRNVGDEDDYAVIQCYRKVLSGALVPRERELKAFSKIRVQKGGSKTFEFTLDEKMFRTYYPGSGEIDQCEILVMDRGEVLFEFKLNV